MYIRKLTYTFSVVKFYSYMKQLHYVIKNQLYNLCITTIIIKHFIQKSKMSFVSLVISFLQVKIIQCLMQ